MKLNEILEKILTEARLDDRSDIAIVKWIIKNRGKEDLPLYLSAIQEDELRTVPHQGTGKQILVNQLEHSGFIIILANSYANAKGWFKEAIELFEAMDFNILKPELQCIIRSLSMESSGITSTKSWIRSEIGIDTSCKIDLTLKDLKTPLIFFMLLIVVTTDGGNPTNLVFASCL